jgi:hypothetical protein
MGPDGINLAHIALKQCLSKIILNIPGPDLEYENSAMESYTFISNEDYFSSTFCCRTRAGMIILSKKTKREFEMAPFRGLPHTTSSTGGR